MIEIPVHSMDGQQVDTFGIDERVLGGTVRPLLLKQAFVRLHANRRQGSSHTRSRSEVAGSNRKMYRQKGTGNARRGSRRVNILRSGGHAFAKRPHSWRMDMPRKMRRLANRNALLAKAIDGEIRLVDHLDFGQPSTKQFAQLLQNLKVDRSCLCALVDTTGHVARSAANIEGVSLTRVDQLNAFDLLNHRLLLMEKQGLEGWIDRISSDKASAGEAS